MVVTATDRGENMLSAKVEVRVRVQDEQDEVPIFEKNFYEVDIKENMPNTSLIKVGNFQFNIIKKTDQNN